MTWIINHSAFCTVGQRHLASVVWSSGHWSCHCLCFVGQRHLVSVVWSSGHWSCHFVYSKTETPSQCHWSCHCVYCRTETPSERRVKQWGFSLNDLLGDETGVLEFQTFLQGEFSTENLEFWLDVENVKKLPQSQVVERVKQVYKYVDEVCASPTIGIFRRKLKAYLFNKHIHHNSYISKAVPTLLTFVPGFWICTLNLLVAP